MLSAHAEHQVVCQLVDLLPWKFLKVLPWIKEARILHTSPQPVCGDVCMWAGPVCMFQAGVWAQQWDVAGVRDTLLLINIPGVLFLNII